MNTNPDFSEKHRKLVVLHEHISALTEQLSTEHYPSLPVYLNNLEHLSKYFEEVSDIFLAEGFEQWLQKTDTELFISIISHERSFILLSNMLGNLKHLFLTG
ncbi:hypothetical protein N5E15_13695 [Pantoea stewartii]|uniref:hypothetical protein n=1 Tax=Pantoea stewartii TaxID=66269 RepID=UPI0021D50CCD|nr:hypothetical protein [Pantoea stewartii]MCU7367646.1 hypothetical protein [Pantoea stewartii]